MAIGGASTMVWLGGQGGASVRYTGENGVIVNNSTDKISADFDVVQHKLTQGSNITITNNVISAQQPDVSQFVTSTEVSTAINNAIGNVRQVPASSGTDANKVLTVDAQGGYDWQPVPSSPGGVTDVKVDGTSVVTAGVANITMPTVPSVDQTYNASSSNPQSGVAVAQAIAAIPAPSVDEVPTVTSSDDGKVLKATYSGGQGSYAWGTDSDTTYTAGNMISIDANNSNAIGVSTTAGITDIQIVNSLPASPVATVMYLIPTT